MTAYIWREGVPIEVEYTGQGEPVAFTWSGQTHQVDMLIRQWRIDQGWWQKRQWRAYFRLSTTSGLLLILYQDLLTGEWFLQGVYD